MRSDETVRRACAFFVFCLAGLGAYAQILNLYEGEICRQRDGDSPEYTCQRVNNCPAARQGIKNNNIPKICSFKGSTAIVCCPPIPDTPSSTTTTEAIPTKTPYPTATGKTSTAAEKCREYSKLVYQRVKDPVLTLSETYIDVKNCLDVRTLIVGGTKAELREFPHMALIGYGEKVDDNRWACGGSLISSQWILTAAHCEKIGPTTFARWVRLGDLNYLNDTDGARPKDYKVVQRVIHPKYRSPSLYYDIALFRLEKNVEYSEFVRPTCLNTNQFLNPTTLVASGWGQTDFGGPFSPDLLKVAVSSIPVKSCNDSYSDTVGKQLPKGIIGDSMICAGYPPGGRDTCGGDSGGPLQIINTDYTCMYTQVGITSFGQFCGVGDKPGVYTRVSKYISWIEQIVWPKK